MKSITNLFAAGMLLTAAASASATIRYVDVNSASPTPPYTTWATAARTIQNAIGEANDGDEVVATNGVYQIGGDGVNRVFVTKPLTVRSVNGPEVTVIKGGPVRCVYLWDESAALVGFTLTNGIADEGAGVYCQWSSGVVSNCVRTGNRASSGGGGVSGATLYNCTITGNSASYGGGAMVATLNNCTITGNSAYFGGGVAGGYLNNCILTGNSADNDGGGASSVGCGLGDCQATLNNCIVYYNIARGSGANYSDANFNYSCTTPLPGGVGNITAEPQLASATHLSAGSPCRAAGSFDYASGVDIDGEAWANQPSIGCDEYNPGALTGSLSVVIVASYTNVATGFAVNFTAVVNGHASASQWEFGDGTVLSNRPYASHKWAAAGDYPVVVRAYNESHPNGVSATATVHVVVQPVHYVAPGNIYPAAPYTTWATAVTNIQDAVDAALVPGTLVLVTNGLYATGGRVVFGAMTNRVALTKPVTVQSVNGSALTVIAGYQLPGTTNGDGAVRCVYLTNGATLVGFTLTNGATRSSGDYYLEQSGGGVWCASASALLSNCVVTGNSADYGGAGGGGVYQGTLNNCILSGNSAGSGGGANSCTLNNCTLKGNSALGGGGASGCKLNGCTLTGNSAVGGGGGAFAGTLNNCTLTGNSAERGGGTAGQKRPLGGGEIKCILNNCIVYFNASGNGANYDSYSSLNYCCTTPQPTNGFGNVNNAPLFVNLVDGDLRLRSDSPCINSGLDSYAPASPDLDGNPRIVGGTVDVGAYEFQSPASVISYAWLEHHGLPTDGSADYPDSDSDGLNNWQEWRAGTDPTNSLSVLQLLSPVSAAPDVIVSWQSVSGRSYFLERSTHLGAQPPFSTLAANIIGQPGTTTFTDTNAVGSGPFFYRVGVQE